MGITASTPKNEQVIIDEMSTNAAKWNSRPQPSSQTALFRGIVPVGEKDFSQVFRENQLDGIFTSDKVVLPIVGGGYNSNHLFRDSRNATRFPVFSDENYTVMHPLGQPGLHLGEGHGSKASHLMIIRHSETGPITFNEMLPSDNVEVLDLETRLRILDKVVENMVEDVPLSQCGPKVIAKADELGVDHGIGIRKFLAEMIFRMPDSEKNGRPGYKLMNKENTDVSNDKGLIVSLLDDVYGNPALKKFAAIQPPSENSQLLSHIHCFRVEEVPECMTDTYRDCEVILKLKKEHIVPLDFIEEEEEEDDGCDLTRQSTRTGSS